MCVIVKDEPDLGEWLLHHQHIGVTNIILFNNGGDIVSDVLTQFVSTGFVIYHSFPFQQHPSMQADCYNTCLAMYRTKYEFLAMLDADEFLAFGDASAHLPDLLRNFTEVGALALNWQSFGSSGHESRPAGGLMASYDHCLPPGHIVDTHVKLIVTTKHTVRMDGGHTATFAEGSHAVNFLGNRVEGAFSSPATHDVIWLAHYGLRSKEEYATHKVLRGDVNNATKGWQYFDAFNSQAVERCTLLMNRSRMF